MIQIDMEMPDNCYCCILCRHADMFCRRLGKMLDRDDCYDERPKNCPLHEVAGPDTVSRQAARMCLTGDITAMNIEQYIKMVDKRLEQLPSVQPEKRTQKRTETHGVCLDTIDRQATLDWLKNEWNGMVTSLFDGIKALPSAQPDLDEVYAHAETEAEARFHAEIIACGDCKHYIRSNATNLTVCNKYNGLPFTVDGIDFCSHAERKDG